MSLVLASLLAVMPSLAPQGGQRNRSTFETVLYLHGGPSRDADFFRRTRAMGFSAVSIPAGGDHALAVKAGLEYYLDQIVGKGVLELRDEQWRPVFEAYQEKRDPRLLARPSCLSSKDVRDGLLQLLRQRANKASDHQPLAVAFGDEISLTRRANPLDLCQHEACQEAFRLFLRGRYSNVVSLNRAWDTSYRSFLEVYPWTADQMRSRELASSSFPENLRPWSDHLEFRDALLRSVIEAMVIIGRGALPDARFGLTGMQPPSAYGGHNFGELMPIMDFFEVYDIGGARESAASQSMPGSLQMMTIMPPARDQPARLPEAKFYEALAHGMAGVIVWSAGEVFSDSRDPTGYGRSIARSLRDAEEAMPAFAGARVSQDPIWLVDSQPSVRAHWMIDSAGDGDTWIRRLSSYEATHSSSLAARDSWTKIFEDLGLQARWVDAQSLSNLLQVEQPSLLVLPATLALSNDSLGAIARYVEEGGMLLADYGTAVYDEYLVRRQEAGLDRLFGIRGRSFKWRDTKLREGRPFAAARLPSGAAGVEIGLQAEIAETQEEYSVQIESSFGKGSAVYLNLAVCEYASVRLDPARVKTAFDLRSRVRRVLAAAGIVEPVRVRGEGLPTCIERILLTARDGRKLLSIRLNATQEPQLMERIAAAGPVKLDLEFP
ncbi:MAG: hypothetical protein ACYTG5_14325, partial [Planctomycetota bacterium]